MNKEQWRTLTLIFFIGFLITYILGWYWKQSYINEKIINNIISDIERYQTCGINFPGEGIFISYDCLDLDTISHELCHEHIKRDYNHFCEVN